MWRPRVAFGLVLVGLLARPVPTETIVLGFPSIEAALAVERAIDGAGRRLQGATCESLFAYFTDSSGRPLSANLVRVVARAADYLRLLRFVNGSAAAQCASGETLAFTSPHGRVIRVCAGRFTERSRTNPTYVEMIVIHELLHALGLEENPPTNQAITATVVARCGG